MGEGKSKFPKLASVPSSVHRETRKASQGHLERDIANESRAAKV